MEHAHSGDRGFTFVELMVVVLIIGVLVSIATPIFQSQATQARAKSCQANQRSISEAIDIMASASNATTTSPAGELTSGGSGWYGILIPGWIKSRPACPVGEDDYYVSADGVILGDQGATLGFRTGHALQ